MKSYTNLKQSRKLAEFLPLESADMYYNVDSYGILTTPEVLITSVVRKKDIPCWSLAALLSTLPSVIKRNGKRMFLTLEKAGAYNLYYKSPNRLDELWETKEEPIDAYYEMIINLHELKLL